MLPAVLEGKDILVRSNTGTGKTISFLIPCVERASRHQRPGAVSSLIISPTRELASQTAEQANQLVVFQPNIVVDIFMGGKNINSEVARCEKGYPTVLIVTPGRMLDHLERDAGKLELQVRRERRGTGGAKEKNKQAMGTGRDHFFSLLTPHSARQPQHARP